MATGGFRASKLDSGNSTNSTLLAGASFTGVWINVLKYASMSVIVNTDQKGTLYVQQSPDAVNVDYVIPKVLIVSAVTTQAAGAFTFPINAQYVRIVYTNDVANQGHFRLQTVVQAVPLIPENTAIIDGNNSTTTALGSDITYTGVYTDTTKFSEMALIFVKDTASQCTLHMDLSTDGTKADRTKSVFYETGSNGGAHTLVVISRFMRLRITNETVAMTSLNLQMVLHPNKSKDLTSTMDQQVSNRNDVNIVRDPTIAQWDLARGFYDGKYSHFFVGNSKTIGSSAWEDVWPNGGLYPFQTSATILDISSANVNDSGYSSGTLTLSAQPSNGDTFTIGSRTYTFQITLTDVDGNIHINASAAGTVLNIVDAIQLGSAGEGAGSGYATSTTINVSVGAVDGTGDSVDFTSLAVYSAANNGNLEVLATTESGLNLSFGASSMAHPPGCHSVKVRGLDGTGEEIEEIVLLNGTTIVQSTKSFLRINRCHVETVGTRGGANYDDITLQVTGGGDVLVVMKGFETPGTYTYGHGEAGMGIYTVPLGKVAYIVRIDINVADAKRVDIALFSVDDCLNSGGSFQARRMLWSASEIKGGGNLSLDFPSYVQVKSLTDLFFRALGVTTGSNKVEVKCQLWIADANAKGR